MNLKVFSTPKLPAIYPRIIIFNTLPKPEKVLYIPTAAPFFFSIQDEILSVTARPSSNTFTVTRAAQSTTAATHALGVAVELRVTAGSVTDIHTAINVVENKVPYEIYIPFGDVPASV